MSKEYMQEFNEWYDAQYEGEWHKDHRDELRDAWEKLRAAGTDDELIASTFDALLYAIRDQYGD